MRHVAECSCEGEKNLRSPIFGDRFLLRATIYADCLCWLGPPRVRPGPGRVSSQGRVTLSHIGPDPDLISGAHPRGNFRRDKKIVRQHRTRDLQTELQARRRRITSCLCFPCWPRVQPARAGRRFAAAQPKHYQASEQRPCARRAVAG